MNPREDLMRHHLWLRHYGNNDSHNDNASVRVEQDFWLPPGGACAVGFIRCESETTPFEAA